METRVVAVETRPTPSSATPTLPNNKWRRRVHSRRRPTSIKVVRITSSKSCNLPTSRSSRTRLGSLVGEPAHLSNSFMAQRIAAGTPNRTITTTAMLWSTSNTSQLTRISMVNTMGSRPMTTLITRPGSVTRVRPCWFRTRARQVLAQSRPSKTRSNHQLQCMTFRTGNSLT